MQLTFDTKKVQTVGNMFKLYTGKVSGNRLNAASVRNSLDSRTLARRGIGARMSSVHNRLTAVESRMKAIDDFIQRGTSMYRSVEDTLIQKSGEITDVERLSAFDQFFKDYWNMKSEHPEVIALRNALVIYGANLFNSDKLLRAAKDLQLYMYRKNGNAYIKIVQGGSDFISKNGYRDLLTSYLGGNRGKWNPTLVDKMIKDGVFLYGLKNQKGDNKIIDYTNKGKKFLETEFKGLNDAIAQLKEPQWKVTGSATWDAFKSNANPLNDLYGWKGASGLTKIGKGLGGIGSLLTIGDNIHDNFYNRNTGEWEWKGENTREFIVDTSVDFLAAGGSMAAGAAVGSFFLPPVGTVVGAATGAAVSFAINYPLPILGDKSMVQYTKDELNALIDNPKEYINNH